MAFIIIVGFLAFKNIGKKHAVLMWSRQESNLDLKFRKLLFYPLNYGTFLMEDGKTKFFCEF